MGVMKDFDIRLRNGGDDAIAAATELNLLTWQENQRLHLTVAERAAILASQGFWALENSPHADALRGLLARHDAT